MASKGRHLAALMTDASRGVDIGNANAKVKQTNMQLGGTRLGASTSDDLLVANTTSDKVGIQTTNPQATLDVEGDVRIGTDLEDNTGRIFKVYYANGDISWGE
jgi:hypothetical protein|tara:strand:- start:1095 stop:1403 length:309 start_codon:yes stop_codon:yes gene_type:complete